MTRTAIELRLAGDLVVRGIRRGDGVDWSVWVHARFDDLDCWRASESLLAGEGCSRLQVDLRGHGASDGRWSAEGAVEDVCAAIAYARAHGGETVLVAGARDGARTALRAAELHGLPTLLISPTAAPGERLEDVRGAGVAKLILAGAHDAEADRVASTLRNASIGWALYAAFPTERQGCELLEGTWGRHAGELIASFAAEQRFRQRQDRAARTARIGASR